MTKNAGEALSEILRRLDNAPEFDDLKEIRTTLDDPAFLHALRDYLRGLNDPDAKAKPLIDLGRVHRDCGDSAAKRKNMLTNWRYGIGGGIALATGGLIGLFASPILLAAILAGGYITTLAVRSTGPLSAEEQVYQDIATRAGKIREALDAG